MGDSLFLFPIDLVDRGVDAVLGDIGDHGIGGVALATAYHHARDIFPHNPSRKVYFHEGGTVSFHPDGSLYGDLTPVPNSLTQRGDLLGLLCRAAEERSMAVTAWTVYLHNSRLAMAHPDRAPRNAFGDPLLTDLCPSHPDVRRYAVALTRDVCRYPVDRILAEALHFKTIEHGFHHERYFLDLGPTARFLLGLCFCACCVGAAEDRGVDAEGVRLAVVDLLSACFDRGAGGYEPADREAVGEMADGQMLGYLGARSASVTSLVAEVAAVAAAAGVRFTFSAHGGSAKGGSTKSSDHPDAAWILGVDLERVTDPADSFEILGYAEHPSDVRALVDAYLARIGSTPFYVGLRPMWPDTRAGEPLAEKVRIARRSGAQGLDFYHYALMPRKSLDWIAAAVSP